MRGLAAIVVIGMVLAGCAPMRFVVDAIPASDELAETVVLSDSSGHRAPKVALIDLTGLIADGHRAALLGPGENPVSTFVESLEKARHDDKVRAIIVRLNSPGGTVTASDTVYREVQYFREASGKPVVMLMADVAASGAMYVACAGDRIIASPTTVTGSIGVIMQTFNISDGLARIGIRADAITSGPNKAMGSPFATAKPEHREIMQGMVNEFYGRFRDVVEQSRPDLSPADIDWVTDGRVVSGTRAAEIGLIDETGDLRTALAAASELAGVSNAQLIKYHRPNLYLGSPYASSPVGAGEREINLIQLRMEAGPSPTAGFYYLWDPGIEW